MNRLITIALISIPLVAGCKKDKAKDEAPATGTPTTGTPTTPTDPAAKPAEPAAAPAPAATIGSWVDMPNSDGFTADIPAGAKPNGIGGAAGYHSDDETFSLIWREVEAEEAAKDLDAVKKDAEAFLFVKWIKAEKTADGHAMAWESSKVDDEGNPKGSQFSYEVRRVVGGKTYKCYGAVAKKENLEVSEKSCLSVRAK